MGEYHRLNVPLENGLGIMKLDEWKGSATLEKIRRATDAYCSQTETIQKLEKIADLLVKHRLSRCDDSRRWELVATGIQYRCTYSRCWKAQKLRPCKGDLEDHLKRKHNYQDDNPEEKEVLNNKVEEGKCYY